MTIIMKKCHRGWKHPQTGIHRVGAKGQKCHDANGNLFKRKRGSSVMSENRGGMQRRLKRFLPAVRRALSVSAKSRQRAT